MCIYKYKKAPRESIVKITVNQSIKILERYNISIDFTSNDFINIIIVDLKIYSFKNFLNIISKKNIINHSKENDGGEYPNKPLLIIYNNKSKGIFEENYFFNSNIMLRAFSEDNKEEIKNYIKWCYNDWKNDNFSLTRSKNAHELLEYAFRAYKNSYLFGTHNNIKPVSFHSEVIFKEKAKNEIIYLNSSLINFKTPYKKKIKLLIIDDRSGVVDGNINIAHSKNYLEEWKVDEYNTDNKIGKENLLRNFISSKILQHVGLDIELNFDFKSLSELWKKKDPDPEVNKKFDNLLGEIDKYKPDIILLDYSFGQYSVTGADFMIKLKNYLEDGCSNDNLYKGPFNKYWIIPITSFSNAFIDDFQAQGGTFTSDEYELSRGADIIGTPFLFLYYLTQMIIQIVDKSNDYNKMIDAISNLTRYLEKKVFSEIQLEQKEFQKEFTLHIERKGNIMCFLKSEDGLLNSLKGHINIDLINQQMNYYEQLLYNLAYRNYENNEEIIIFHDLLKKAR